MTTVSDVLARPDITQTISPELLTILQALSSKAEREGRAQSWDWRDLFRVVVEPTGIFAVLMPSRGEDRAQLAFQRVGGRLADYDLSQGLDNPYPGGGLPTPYEIASMPIMTTDMEAAKVTAEDIHTLKSAWDRNDPLVAALLHDPLIGIWNVDGFIVALLRPCTYDHRASIELHSLLGALRDPDSANIDGTVRELLWLRADFFGHPYCLA